MATINRFEDLECWQEARELVGIVYSLTKKNEFKKDYELVRQVRKSAVSSMANISEGFHRNITKDFMRFLDYSRSSVAETLSHLYVALDQKYINEDELGKVKNQANIVWKKVNNFIAYLNKSFISTNQTNQTNKTD